MVAASTRGNGRQGGSYSTAEMTEHYSHLSLEDLSEVVKVQERLLG
jgi:hypothetical protein